MTKQKKPKIGRPAIGPQRNLRISDSAWATIERAATAEGLSVSEYIRRNALAAAEKTLSGKGKR